MYISSLRELRDAVEDHFGKTARYLATHRSEGDPERGYVQFLLYEALCFYFVVLERPYSSLGVSRRVEGEAPISDFILGDLTFVENVEADVTKAFAVVDAYCRLLLPDKYLSLFDREAPDKQSSEG